MKAASSSNEKVKRVRNATPMCNTPPELFQVVIECRDEAQQRELFERLRGEGYKCRVLTL